MANQIRVLVPSEPLVPGETVSIPVKLTLDEPTTIRCVFVEYRAGETTKAEYTTTTVRNGKSRSQRRTATETVSTAKEDFLLEGKERLGFFARMGDNVAGMMGGGRRSELEAGEHSYSVDITIPHTGLPSLNGNKCKVFYTLTACVDRPMAFDYKDVQQLSVRPKSLSSGGQPKVVRYPEDSPPGFWDKMFGAKAKLRLALDTDVFKSGEVVKGLFQVDDENATKMKGALVRLVGVESTIARGHSDSSTHRSPDVRILGETTFRDLSEEFEFEAHFDDMPISAVGVNFHVDWYVEIELDVPWAKNPTIRCPVTVV